MAPVFFVHSACSPPCCPELAPRTSPLTLVFAMAGVATVLLIKIAVLVNWDLIMIVLKHTVAAARRCQQRPHRRMGASDGHTQRQQREQMQVHKHCIIPHDEKKPAMLASEAGRTCAETTRPQKIRR